MPEHSTRPDRPGPWARRRAALAAAALAAAGLVLLSFALVARDSSGQAPRPAVVPAGGPTTVPVPTIGTSVSTRRTTRAGVDRPRETAAGSECQPGVPSTVRVGTARELQRALDRAVKGHRIWLADGVYQGEFVLRRSGTASTRIALRVTQRGAAGRHPQGGLRAPPGRGRPLDAQRVQRHQRREGHHG